MIFFGSISFLSSKLTSKYHNAPTTHHLRVITSSFTNLHAFYLSAKGPPRLGPLGSYLGCLGGSSALLSFCATSCVGISAVNCSFPFTYAGSLLYSCTRNVTSVGSSSDTCTGCFVSNPLNNRTWHTCTSDLSKSLVLYIALL